MDKRTVLTRMSMIQDFPNSIGRRILAKYLLNSRPLQGVPKKEHQARRADWRAKTEGTSDRSQVPRSSVGKENPQSGT